MKLLKIAGILLGSIGAAAGLVVFDLHRRADAALEAHRARLRADITARRDRYRPCALLSEVDSSMPVLVCLPCPQRIGGGPVGRYPAFEDGHSGQGEADERISFASERLQTDHRVRAEALIAGLAMSAQVWREAGVAGSDRRRGVEHELLTLGWKILCDRDTERDDLQQLASGLEMLEANLPRPEDILAREYVLDRVEAIRVVEAGNDPLGFITVAPGWQDLFSRKLLLVRVLNQLSENHRLATAGLDPIDPALTTSALRNWSRAPFSSGESERVLWLRLRTEVAVARYRLDLGDLPQAYSDLVPAYLPEIPCDPASGHPYELEDGTLPLQPCEHLHM